MRNRNSAPSGRFVCLAGPVGHHKGERRCFFESTSCNANCPVPKNADPNAAAALQELLGGKYGEMSTLNNYLFQSFSFRNKTKLRPFYSLVASITAEELGHVELVSTGVNMLANGPETETEDGGDISDAPFADQADARLASGFIHAGKGVRVADSEGVAWNGSFVTSTGNLVVDLVHNFHLECGARLHKLRVYETLSDPCGRAVCGYLLVRGSVHAHAYALAIQQITGANVKAILPTPNIPLDKIPECRPWLEQGSHRKLYRFSPNDYKEMAGVWGHGETALPTDPPGELEVVDGHPDGGHIPDLSGSGEAFTPDYAPQELFEVASKLYKKSR